MLQVKGKMHNVSSMSSQTAGETSNNDTASMPGSPMVRVINGVSEDAMLRAGFQ